MSRSKTNAKKSYQYVAPDYASMKVAELKTLCKKREVSTVGTKADIVARLEENDSKATKKTTRKPVASKKGKAPPKESSEEEDSDEVSEEVPKKKPTKNKQRKSKHLKRKARRFQSKRAKPQKHPKLRSP